MEQQSQITMQDMVNLVKELDHWEQEKEKAADALKEINAKVSVVETKIVQALQDLKQTKFVVDGLGTVSIRKRESVQTPKTQEEKQQLWKYIVEKYGEEAAWNKFGINSQSLNSFFKEEREQIEDVVEQQLFKLPGVGEPQVFLGLSFRK